MVDEATAPVAEVEDAPLVEGAETDADSGADEILDRYSKPDTESTEDAEPPEEAKAEGEKAEESTKDEESLPDEKLDPEELKSIFKKYPKIRAEHYSLAAYNELFGSVKEAREVKALFPTKEEAVTARSQAEDLLLLDEAFRAKPADFAETLAEADRGAFTRLAAALPQVAYKLDPTVYQDVYVAPVLAQFTTQFYNWAQQQGDEDAVAAISIINERLTQGRQQVARLPDNDPRLRRLNEFEQKEAERSNYAATQFYSTVGDSVQGAVAKEAESTLSRMGADLSSGAKKEIINRVVDEVGEVLKGDSYLQRRIQFYGRGAQDPKTRDAVVTLMMGRARAVIRPKVTERLSWMTRDILSLQAKKDSKTGKVRKDVGEGGSGGAKGSGKTPGLKETARMSADDILDAFSK